MEDWKAVLHPRKAPGPDGLGAGRGGQLVKLLLNASCVSRTLKETTITPVHEVSHAKAMKDERVATDEPTTKGG